MVFFYFFCQFSSGFFTEKNTATIKSFVSRDDKNEVELVLPEGMSAADIRVVQHVVTKMSGLELVPVQKGNRERQWIVRRSG